MFKCKCGGEAEFKMIDSEGSATCPKCGKLLALKLNVKESKTSILDWLFWWKK